MADLNDLQTQMQIYEKALQLQREQTDQNDEAILQKLRESLRQNSRQEPEQESRGEAQQPSGQPSAQQNAPAEETVLPEETELSEETVLPEETELSEETAPSEETAQEEPAAKGVSAALKRPPVRTIAAVTAVAVLIAGGIIGGIAAGRALSSRNSKNGQQIPGSILEMTSSQLGGDAQNDEIEAPAAEAITLRQITQSEAAQNGGGNRHPFAIAVEEYISGADYPAAWYFTDIKEDGIEIAIATRGEYIDETLIIYRLFYIYDRAVQTYDFRNYEEFAALCVTSENQIVLASSQGHNYGYDFYSISSGEVKQVDALGWREDSALGDRNAPDYYWYGDSDNEISRAQYTEYFMQFGLSTVNFLHVSSTFIPRLSDQTAEILAMTPPETAYASSTLAVNIDGSQAAFEAYRIDGGDYVKLRDVAMALNGTGRQFDITEGADEMVLNISRPYTPAGGELTKGGGAQAGIPVDWSAALSSGELRLTGYLINEERYFTVQDIAKLLDISIEY